MTGSDASSHYLLRRRDFGMNGAPVGACILCANDGGPCDKVPPTLARAGGF
jgi:hypothetical protein